jgi:excisionase family DNA binding protein
MEKLLNIDELSEILGVTIATIYSWTSRNKIPHIKLSKRLLKFMEKEIMDWIAEKSVNADISPVSKKNKNGKCTRPSSNLHDDCIERIIRNAKEKILSQS